MIKAASWITAKVMLLIDEGKNKRWKVFDNVVDGIEGNERL